MGTRSTISIKNKDGTINSIYCNYDGYIHGVGKTLYKHYTNEDKVRELISLGDISALRPEIEGTKLESYHFKDGEDVIIDTYKDEEAIKCQEFNYLFYNNEWYLLADRKNIKLKDILNVFEILKKLDIYMSEDNKIAIASVFDELVD
jgi:hypothetical protein